METQEKDCTGQNKRKTTEETEDQVQPKMQKTMWQEATELLQENSQNIAKLRFNERYASFYEHNKRKLDSLAKEYYFAEWIQIKLQTPYVLNEWQQWLVTKLTTEKTEKEIYWVVDERGKTGKTWLEEKLSIHFNAIRLENSAASIRRYSGQPIVSFDLSRSRERFTKYDLFCKMKDGRCFPHLCDFDKPEVVVFANFHPPKKKK